MEQKTEASQAVDDQAVSVEVYSNAVWLTKGMQVFRLAYTGESDADRNWYAGQLRAALKAQPAPTEAARDRIPMPTNADQAELMQKLGLAWLQTNAPDRLTDAGRAAQGEDSARLDAAHDVLAERRRQIEKEGWSQEHDDMHDDGQMAVAAGFYALQCGYPHERTIWRGDAPMYWPWAASWWKPTTKRANLVKAGALILAEIERIDRARASAETGGVKP